MEESIQNTVIDLVSNFLYYDRKEDEELGVGDIDKAVSDGVISVDEICSLFKEKLVEGLK